MNKLKLIALLALLILLSAPPLLAQSWNLEKIPHSEDVERLLHRWIELNRHEFCGEFKVEEEDLLKRLLTGTLGWAHANGNHFDAQAFLDLFSNRNDRIGWCHLPQGGLLFVLESTYLRIALDPTISEFLPTRPESEFPLEGRWFAAFGSGNRTSLFYFSNVGPRDKNRTF